MRTGTIFLAIVMIAGIYVLPSIVATFAGSHTLTHNAPGSTGGSSKKLNCFKCHQYIQDEANLAGNANVQDIYAEHYAASKNVAYTTYVQERGTDFDGTGGPLGTGNFYSRRRGTEIYKNGADWQQPSGTIRTLNYASYDWSACQLCHRASGLDVGGTHSRYTVTTCTYEYCHGNGTASGQNRSGTSRLGDTGIGYGSDHDPATVGYKLNSTDQSNGAKDAHTQPFRRLQKLDSEYVDRDGNRYTADYYLCLACHSYTGMSMHIQRPQAVEFYFDQQNEDNNKWELNDTLYEDTEAYKAPGSSFKV